MPESVLFDGFEGSGCIGQSIAPVAWKGEGTTGEAMAKPNRDPGSDS